MANAHGKLDLSESSIYGKDADKLTGNEDDAEAEVELRAGDDPKLEGQIEELEASTEEEVDALHVGLLQEDEIPNARDGSGRITDDTAEERLAEITETGPMQPDAGVMDVTPGRDDTSAVLRRHYSATKRTHAETLAEGNTEQPSDESNIDRKDEEGAAG